LVELEDVDQEAALVRIDRRLFVVLLDQLLELLAQAVPALTRAAELPQPIEESMKWALALARMRVPFGRVSHGRAPVRHRDRRRRAVRAPGARALPCAALPRPPRDRSRAGAERRARRDGRGDRRASCPAPPPRAPLSRRRARH